jgi:cobalt-zinc-cadmium efflux system outer membrane protein
LLPLTRPFTVDRQGGPPQTDYQLSYPIDWFLFGKRAAAMASASAGMRVSEADYADLVRQRVRDAGIAFYDVLEAKALLDLARQDLENLRRVEAATRKAVGAGGRPPVELNRVRLDVLKSEQTLREAETTLAVAIANLRSRLGRRDPDPTFDISGNLDAPLSTQPGPVEQALALAEQNRPDIASLRLQVDKATKDIHSEKTKAYPQVTPQVGYTHQFQQKAIGFPDADSWMMSVNTPLPFFDRNQGNIAKAKSVFVQNSLNLEGGLVDLRAEIVQVVREFETAYRTATAVAGEQLKVATQVRDSITKAYEAGGRTLLEVLDAQRNYRETYRLYITSRANYWRSSIRFNAAVGKQVLPHEQHAH